MHKYDFVFVVLVYRNTNDLNDFFYHFCIENSKVIVVNSYYDDDTEKEFNQIADRYSADFISVPNKGYGAGNNVGVKWAIDHYQFDNIVISNADIIIEKMSASDIDPRYINAPDIKNKKGKQQNPMQVIDLPIFDRFKYWCFKHPRWGKMIYLPIAINKVITFVYRNICTGGGLIYSSHGSFLIIPEAILSKCFPLYNEKMFLFSEEDHLAKLVKSKGLRQLYNPLIKIFHKEDGSVGTISSNVMELTRASYITYYEYWHYK